MKLFFGIMLAVSFAFTSCDIEEVINLAPGVPVVIAPANLIEGVEVTGVNLEWTCVDVENDALIFDVYFSIDGSPTLKKSEVTSMSYATGELEVATTYFWKIVAKDEGGKETESPIWSFTTGEKDDITSVPSDPNPADGVTDVSLQGMLSWTCNNTLVTGYEVYMAPEGEDLYANMIGGPVGTNCEHDNEPDTKYYWQVVGRTSDEQVNFPGPKWSFTTGSK